MPTNTLELFSEQSKDIPVEKWQEYAKDNPHTNLILGQRVQWCKYGKVMEGVYMGWASVIGKQMAVVQYIEAQTLMEQITGIMPQAVTDVVDFNLIVKI